MFEKLFKKKGFRVWFSVSVSLIAFMIIAAVVSSIFYDFLRVAIGREIPIYADTEYGALYEPTSVSKDDAIRRGNELNEDLCEEGFVLLKNDNSALPLQKGAKISVFGKNSVNPVYNGSGSGGTNNDNAISIYKSLRNADFKVNEVLEAFYNNNSRSGPARDGNPSIETGVQVLATAETPYSYYTDDVTRSYSDYNHAAIIVLSRIGGEGWDLPRISGDDSSRHYLELDPNEQELVRQVTKAGFGKVIVLVNSLSIMEFGWAEDGTYGKIDAALYVGGPGNSGMNALGKILNGEVNPSGRTVDTWAADFMEAPAAKNFGDNGKADGNVYTVNGAAKYFNFVDYEEGIYVGYRYYETRGLNDSAWYDTNVVYPFGYGKSYTKFSQTIVNKDEIDGEEIKKGEKITVKVNVHNTGSTDGKDVVQIYATVPYTPGGIEKAHKVLVGFAKTEVIRAGQSKTVEIEIDPYDFASYDYSDANGRNGKGYEIEADTRPYIFTVGKNAHDEYDTFSGYVREDIVYNVDPVTGTPVVNRFDDADDQLGSVLSRNNWEGTKPSARTDAERAVDNAFINQLNDRTTNNPNEYQERPKTGKKTDLDMFQLIYMEDYEGFKDDRWDELLDSLTVSEMASLYNHGAFQTNSILHIGKVKTVDGDGPYGFTNFIGGKPRTCAYASEVILASTWNTDLVYRMGECVGDEGLRGGDETDKVPFSGWYAPGANIHRTPFGGRNGEYFSEDGFLSGKMAAAEIRGAASKGLYCYIKHFVANDQETSRQGLCTWLTEQSLREIYLKPFEIAVKEGKTRGLMSSFNRLGTKWTGGDYRLITEVLREEWGFKGAVICDFNTSSSYYMDPKQMIYAGGDLNLTADQFWTNFNESNPGDVTMLRRAAKNVLYMVSDSSAMNAPVDHYLPPLWVWLFSAAGILAVAGLTVWGVFAVRKAVSEIKESVTEETDLSEAA